jgi:DNA-binding CsgD family transcriptional regulator
MHTGDPQYQRELVTQRETDILALIAQGNTTKEIAKALFNQSEHRGVP